MSLKILRSLTSLNKPIVILNVWQNGAYQQIYILKECLWKKLEILILCLSQAIPIFEIDWNLKNRHLKLPPFPLDLIGSSLCVKCHNSVMKGLPDLSYMPNIFSICAKIIKNWICFTARNRQTGLKSRNRSTGLYWKSKAYILYQVQSICWMFSFYSTN